jgi:hypothetical protein
MLSQNHVLDPNQHIWDFSSSNFIVQDHIQIATGDALSLSLDGWANSRHRHLMGENPRGGGDSGPITSLFFVFFNYNWLLMWLHN